MDKGGIRPRPELTASSRGGRICRKGERKTLLFLGTTRWREIAKVAVTANVRKILPLRGGESYPGGARERRRKEGSLVPTTCWGSPLTDEGLTCIQRKTAGEIRKGLHKGESPRLGMHVIPIREILHCPVKNWIGGKNAHISEKTGGKKLQRKTFIWRGEYWKISFCPVKQGLNS